MKKIMLLFFILFLFALNSNANNVVSYEVSIEQHPEFGDHVKPLIIKEEVEYHYGTVDITIHKYWPMIYMPEYRTKAKKSDKESSLVGSNEGWWIDYYDAYMKPDKSGYILVRRRQMLDSSELVGVTFKDKKGRQFSLGNPQGDKIYWSKDNKFIVTAEFPPSEVEEDTTIRLYFYDIDKNEMTKTEVLKNWDETSKYIEKNLMEAK